ncbi:MAG TPA: hypothetical protein VFF39_06050 [Verrucomicrobiae bacterium]|jgi:hypothetical protein|nr:hypothetical protein [Verrucomicrobiae bacterium]
MSPQLATIMKPAELPALTWATGIVQQILVQPGEKFFVFSLRETKGTTVILRIADPHTGVPVSSVTSDNPIYDLLKEAFFRKLNVEVGYRDFGPDPQAGINKLCIDRVSFTQ